MNTLRFLLSIYVYERKLNESERLLLFNAYFIAVERQARSGSNFTSDEIFALEQISSLMCHFYHQELVSRQTMRKHIKELYSCRIRLIFSSRAYFGVKNNSEFNSLWIRWRFIEAKRPRPERRTGVGYRDKGHRRFAPTDGGILTMEQLAEDYDYVQSNWLQKKPDPKRFKYTFDRVQRELRKGNVSITNRIRKLSRWVRERDHGIEDLLF